MTAASGLPAERFVSKRDGNLEVYVMNPDGSGQRNLTRSPWNEGSASWSPRSRLAKSH